MSTQSPRNWIELSILIIALLALTWFIGGAGSTQQNPADTGRLLGQTEQLNQRLAALEARGASYLEHAPRNYDDYFRDTKVIYPALMLEVDLLDREIREQIAADPNAAVSGRTYLDDVPRQGLILAWDEFRSKLEEQLGVDPEMPRLEWGYEHITSEIGGLLAAVDTAARSVRAKTGGEAASNAMMMLIAVAAWALVLLLWFAFRAQR